MAATRLKAERRASAAGVRCAASWLTSGLLFLIAAGGTPAIAAELRLSLQQQLAREDPAVLARAARAEGDPQRGVMVFYQSRAACGRCHGSEGDDKPLGPDLARIGTQTTDVHLVQSILQPSKVITEGYQPVTVITVDGKTVTGLLDTDTDDRLVLRDGNRDGQRVTIATEAIDERIDDGPSIMPTDLANQLGSRGQFLDLVRYLMEIVAGGPVRAKQLRPPTALLATQQVPDYEHEIDHAGMIAALDATSLERGEAIYTRVCVNCHGTPDKQGTMPTSLRFATGTFKGGSDPFRMYQTLTHGYGMMAPQTWMVPQQKYDVIHYIREVYLRKHNPTQYVPVQRDYFATLPKGTSHGPEPSAIEPWVTMDYGPSLIGTYEIGDDDSNYAYKGIAVRLDGGTGGVTRGHHWMVYDHDTLRVAAGWSGEGFIDFNGIMFNGRHEIHPRIVGTIDFANSIGPGWGDPGGGGFADPRLQGRDGRCYGPLPRRWAHYRGLYHSGNQVVISYRVGTTDVLEMPGVVRRQPTAVFSRTLNIGPRSQAMDLQVATVPGAASAAECITTGSTADSPLTAAVALYPRRLQSAGSEAGPPTAVGFDEPTLRPREIAQADSPRPDLQPTGVIAGVTPPVPGARWSTSDKGDLRLHLPAGDRPLRFTVWVGRSDRPSEAASIAPAIDPASATRDLTALTRGGPPRWPSVITTEGIGGSDDRPLAVDVLPRPVANPWLCQVRMTGLDFLPGGRQLAVSTWDGDVWLVRGINTPEEGITWQRIASGLFQPLGLKVVDGQIYVACRDQIVILRDLNGDGETDYYENFNNDHQVTEHFHEFALGLQTDGQGNFYYAKGARHGKKALVPQHGTLLRVSPDGRKTEILARGFRAPNGVCVDAQGQCIVTDQEGHWIPKNRINWIVEGGFYGNTWGYHDLQDTSDASTQPPLCWITNRIDRSPAEVVRVTSSAWGPLNDALLCLSYGYGKVFVVFDEQVQGLHQGGVFELPIPPFPTGIMRGRFHPQSGQLYACGMFAWAGNQQQPGGLYRIRATGKPLHVPVALHATQRGLRITFSDPLDPDIATDVDNYGVTTWTLKRTANYGSDHHNERPSTISNAKLLADGKTVLLELPACQPTWCMEIRFAIRAADGAPIEGVIHNTIHHLGAGYPASVTGPAAAPALRKPMPCLTHTEAVACRRVGRRLHCREDFDLRIAQPASRESASFNQWAKLNSSRCFKRSSCEGER